MPYSEKFENVLQARAHGARLDKAKLNRIPPEKAKAMLTEAKREGQLEALKSMKK